MLKEIIQQGKVHDVLREKYYENDVENPLGRYKLLMADYHKGEPLLTIGPNSNSIVI
jgi:hypothetical protein